MSDHDWYLRTEWWLTFVATVLGALVMTGVLGSGLWSQIAGAAVMVLSNYGYTKSRTDIKVAALTSLPVPTRPAPMPDRKAA